MIVHACLLLESIGGALMMQLRFWCKSCVFLKQVWCGFIPFGAIMWFCCVC